MYIFGDLLQVWMLVSFLFFYLFVCLFILKKFNIYIDNNRVDFFGFYKKTKKFGFFSFSTIYLYIYLIFFFYCLLIIFHKVFYNFGFLYFFFDYNLIFVYVYCSTLVFFFIVLYYNLFLFQFFMYNSFIFLWVHLGLNVFLIFSYDYSIYFYLIYLVCCVFLFSVFYKKIFPNVSKNYKKSRLLDSVEVQDNIFKNKDVKTRFKL